MRRIADAKQARGGPGYQAIDCHAEQLDIVERPQFIKPVFEKRSADGDRSPEGLDARRAHTLSTALGNYVGTLPVVIAIDGDDHRSGLEMTQYVDRIAGTLREAEPEHIDRCPQIPHRKSSRRAHGRRATITTNHETCMDLKGPVRGSRFDTADPPGGANQPRYLCLHEDPKARKASSLFEQEVQEVPLRHQCDEPARRQHTREIGDPEG